MAKEPVVTARFLTRGDIVVSSDLPGFIKDPVVVLYAEVRPGGGAGMGEYPPSWTVVFSDGRAVSGDEWSETPASIPRTYAISGKAMFATDGRLVLLNTYPGV